MGHHEISATLAMLSNTNKQQHTHTIISTVLKRECYLFPSVDLSDRFVGRSMYVLAWKYPTYFMFLVMCHAKHHANKYSSYACNPLFAVIFIEISQYGIIWASHYAPAYGINVFLIVPFYLHTTLQRHLTISVFEAGSDVLSEVARNTVQK